MSRGGKREGAGRPAGLPNRETAKIRDAVAFTGLSPLEYLLGVMRDESMDEATRRDAAKAAAPYVHPRLAAVEHSGEMSILAHEQFVASLK